MDWIQLTLYRTQWWDLCVRNNESLGSTKLEYFLTVKSVHMKQVSGGEVSNIIVVSLLIVLSVLILIMNIKSFLNSLGM
jgi:hypothetical protein